MDELGDILAAQKTIAGQVHRTALVGCSSLGESLGVRLLFKLEMFQKTGSFKVRGVLNKLGRLTEAEKQRGVIGVSSGNHAQALAWGASRYGLASTLVMPANGAASKIAATRGYGGQVHLTEGDLLETFLGMQQEHGLTPVHPFNDPDIIAGAGTVGLEILEAAPDADYLFVSVGGGGLISGVATAAKLRKPALKVIGVEPAGAPVVARSLEAGRLVRLETIDTIADGLCPPFTGEHTVNRIRRFVDEMVMVSDDEILAAMRSILERVKVVAEPSAAAAFAALQSGKVRIPSGATVVCVLSGGNVDGARLKSLLATDAGRSA